MREGARGRGGFIKVREMGDMPLWNKLPVRLHLRQAPCWQHLLLMELPHCCFHLTERLQRKRSHDCHMAGAWSQGCR